MYVCVPLYNLAPFWSGLVHFWYNLHIRGGNWCILVHFGLTKEVSATRFPSLSSPPSPFGTFPGANAPPALSGALSGACGPQVTLFVGSPTWLEADKVTVYYCITTEPQE